VLIIGGQKDAKLSSLYDGFSVFITDGSPSKSKIIGENITYPQTQKVIFNIKK
jgi:hypothetical protein